MHSEVAGPTGQVTSREVSVDRLWGVAVWVAAVIYGVVLSIEAIAAHRRFGTGFDTAIYDQLVWLLANGHEPFSTVVSRPMLADHFQPGLLVFVPLYWLGGGVESLLVVQTVALALAGPALYGLARGFGARPALAALPALLWLACPFVARVNLWEFRPTALVPVLLVVSVLAATQRRHVLLWASALLALSLKEDVSTIYVVLGVLLLWQGRRRLGAALASVAAAWFVVATAVMRAGGGSLESFGRRFAGDRGDSMFEAFLWMVQHPLETLGDVVGESLLYLVLLLVSTGGLALLAPAWILLGAPTALHNALSAYEPQHLLSFHYHLVPLTALFIAAAAGVRRLDSAGRRLRLASAGGVTLAVLLAVVAGVWAHGRWTEGLTLPREATRAALDVIPATAPVAASPHLLPHLSRRVEVYTLPEPFIPLDTGSPLSDGEFAERARGVRYAAYLRGDVPHEFDGEAAEVEQRLERAGFVIVAEAGNVRVLRRD